MTQRRDVPNSSAIADDEVLEQLKAEFRQNYETLRLEGGHVLADGAYQRALEHVIFYWRRLRQLAIQVTATEIRLSLPGQKSPKGKPFTIEGVVDVVRQGDKVELYDIKTQPADEVRAELDLYEEQLNVYAYIWTRLYRECLDRVAIVATGIPEEVVEAVRSGDEQRIADALEQWNPVIELPLTQEDVDRTLYRFGCCVDDIEDGRFDPPPLEKLEQPLERRRRRRWRGSSTPTFAQVYCPNCDARFSCDSYREYLKRQRRRPDWWTTARRVELTDEEVDAWIDENLRETP